MGRNLQKTLIRVHAQYSASLQGFAYRDRHICVYTELQKQE